jgi:hypothetical protein
MSVRITAAGAVFVACVSFLTAPARACDDRFIKKCEKTAAAAAAAEEVVAEPAKRTSAKRVKAVASRHAKQARLVRRSQAPRFAVRSARGLVLASDAERTPPAESPLARRFRGFIDPQPIAQNAFEALRKRHAAALDFDAAALLPQAEAGGAKPVAETAAPDANPVNVATTPKQDKLVAKPAALIELASAESRPVALAALAPARPAAEPVLAAPVIVTEAPPERQPNRFSIHGLVLALCGALGAASALRFIVGA